MEELFVCPECGSENVEVIRERGESLPFAVTTAATSGTLPFRSSGRFLSLSASTRGASRAKPSFRRVKK